MNNQELIKKADFALSDLANGGLLNPEQSDSFIRKLLVQPTILKQSRVVTMNSPSRKINKIGFATRIMRPAVSATGLSESDRSKPTTGQIELNTKEIIAEIRLPYDVIEDNVERGNINAAGGNSAPTPVSGGIKDTIMDLIAERAALDIEELGLLGDTAHATDDYLALCDGFIKRSTDNVVDQGDAAITKTMFKNGLKAMPDQYLRNLSALRNYVSINNEIEYRDSLSDRETGLGDSVIEGFRGVFGYGVPVEKVALMPSDTGLLTHPLNFIFGIQRQMSIEVDKIITDRVFVIVLTARLDFQVEETEAVVKYANIG